MNEKGEEGVLRQQPVAFIISHCRRQVFLY